MGETTDERIDLLRQRIATVADFPEPGIQFKDITTLLSCLRAFPTTTSQEQSQQKVSRYINIAESTIVTYLLFFSGGP